MLMLVPLLACGGDDSPVEPPNEPVVHETELSITGTVRSAADGSPIVGAPVRLSHIICVFEPCSPYTVAVATTDAEGAYSIRTSVGLYAPDNWICPGQYKISTEPAGYYPGHRDIFNCLIDHVFHFALTPR
jgi:hypothetical protein